MLGKFITSMVSLFMLGSMAAPVIAITGSENENQSPPPPLHMQNQMQMEQHYEFEGHNYKRKVEIVFENGVMRKKVEVETPNGSMKYKIVKTVDDVMPDEEVNDEDFDDGLLVDENKRCAQFEDIQAEDKLCKYLHKARVRSVVSPNARFFANAPVSRAQFAGMVVRAFGLTADTTDVESFADIDETNTFYNQIMILKTLGIVTGAQLEDGVTRYFPRKPITRGEAIKILVNTLEQSGFEFDDTLFPSLTNKFRDEGIDGDRFADHIKKLYASEGKMPEVIVKGYSDGFLRTGRFVSRIEAIVMITRAMWAAGLIDNVEEVPVDTGTGTMMDDDDDDYDDDDDSNDHDEVEDEVEDSNNDQSVV